MKAMGTPRTFCSTDFQDVIEVVFVAVAVMPRHFALATPYGARPLEIKVETMSLRDFSKNVADEHFKAVSNDLSPAMSERFSHDIALLSTHPQMPLA